MQAFKALARRLGGWILRLSGEETRVSRHLTIETHPLATEVTLVLDRPRKLRFTLSEASEFRRRTGISVWTGEGTPNGTGLDIGALDEEQLLELLTVTCIADDPTVTPETLGPHLAGETLMEVVAALMVLVGDFLPDAPEDVLENPLMASALLRLMSADTGRSPLKPSAFRKGNTGGLPRA
jgi:hypothetical protein